MIMKAIDPRIRAIVDWGNFRVENQEGSRIESTRKLLPYTGRRDRSSNAAQAGAMVLYWKGFSKGIEDHVRDDVRRGTAIAATCRRTPTRSGGALRRGLPRPVTTPRRIRAVLVAMAKDARSRLGGEGARGGWGGGLGWVGGLEGGGQEAETISEGGG